MENRFHLAIPAGDLDKAIKFYSENPRPYYLNGESKFYTPSAF